MKDRSQASALPAPSVALAAALLAACGSHRAPPTDLPADLPATVGGATRLTGGSPFAPGCNGAPPEGTEYRGAEVEPWIAVAPGDPQHLVGVWQQDRWSNGGANGLLAAVSRDGGLTWTRSGAAFTRCSGGTPVSGGDYERASDPWVAIAADGTVHQIAYVFDRTVSPQQTRRQAILASRSGDGGLTWSDPTALQADTALDVAEDKETISVDPSEARYVYATWDRLAGLDGPDAGQATGPAWFARSVDGGLTWEPARVIADPGLDAQTIGNQIAVLPGGGLVDVFMLLRDQSTSQATLAVAMVRSTDHGETWSAAATISAATPVGVVDPKGGATVRSGDILPAVAVDRRSGRLWVAWADSRFSGGRRDGIALSRSDDGGLTWSAPLQVNQAPLAQAFNPALAVGPDGTVAVSHLDFRNDSPSDQGHLWTTGWLATSADGGQHWQEAMLGLPFDLRLAPNAGGLFVGDYAGLVARAGTFTGIFAMTNPGAAGNGTDVFAGGPQAGAGGTVPPAPVAEQRVGTPRPLAERVRSLRESRGGRGGDGSGERP
jgi:hypothetical protein